MVVVVVDSSAASSDRFIHFLGGALYYGTTPPSFVDPGTAVPRLVLARMCRWVRTFLSHHHLAAEQKTHRPKEHWQYQLKANIHTYISYTYTQ